MRLLTNSARWSLILMLGFFPLVIWANPESTGMPSLELLEFLGGWETDDGEWMDPLQLLEELDVDIQNVKIEDVSDG